jgi:hypothetical protein
MSLTPGACECGLAFSVQMKLPMQSYLQGLTSGSSDYSGLVHLGVPLFTQSAVWFTAGYTYTGTNRVLEGWPLRQWMQMYEGSAAMGLSDHWDFILQLRYESPLMNQTYVNLNYIHANTNDQDIERMDTSWNALMYWRGSESAGFRYRFKDGNSVNLLMVEDWGFGKEDNTGWTYINNAPDVEFLIQTHLAF